MRLGDLSSGAGKLNHSLKMLRLHWDETKRVWTDQNRIMFEEKFLGPLEPRVVQSIEAISRLSLIMSMVEKDLSK